MREGEGVKMNAGLDRRAVLRGGVLAAGGLFAGGVASAPASAVALSGPDFEELRATLSKGASLFLPGEASYEALAVPFNHQYAYRRPVAILLPVVAEDVQAAVRWCVRWGVQFTPRSGVGHNYAGYSTSRGLVVIASRLRGISWEPERVQSRTVAYETGTYTHNAGALTVQAGVTNGDLHPLLEEQNLLLPTGRCSTVGVAGLILGGGIGFSDKMAGLTSDRLISTNIVTADGTVLRCSEVENADLFWACRGGAGNSFGFHLDFTVSYDKYVGTVAIYKFKWGKESAVAAMQALQQVCLNLQKDPRFHARVGIGTTGATTQEIAANAYVSGLGQFYGTASELRTLFAGPLAIGTEEERTANLDSIRNASTAEASKFLNEDATPTPFTGTSRVLDAPLTETQATNLLNGVLAWPGSCGPDGVDIAFFALGGNVNTIASDATAFIHRRSLFIAQLNVNWADHEPESSLETHRNWLHNLCATVFTDGPLRAYQNFPDPYIANAQQAYYGSNYPRLRSIKTKYDPAQVFRYNQSIQPL